MTKEELDAIEAALKPRATVEQKAQAIEATTEAMVEQFAGQDPQEIEWTKYPIRSCRTLHFCQLCRFYIECGDDYYDGGSPRRAHVACVNDLAAGYRRPR